MNAISVRQKRHDLVSKINYEPRTKHKAKMTETASKRVKYNNLMHLNQTQDLNIIYLLHALS